MPWVLFYRDRQDDGEYQHAYDYLDCSTCTEDEETRAHWHCGFRPRSSWVGEISIAPRSHLPPDRTSDPHYVCHGWLINQPQVCEASRFHMWAENGQLAVRLEAVGREVTGILVESLELLRASTGEAERHHHQLSLKRGE